MKRATGIFRLLRDAARLMVGQTPYEAYRAHMLRRHPGLEIMSEAEFFRAREAARYGSRRSGRCC